MYKPIRKADLIKGGTAVKQGEIFTLGFQLFDADGLVIVPTVEQAITVKIANKTGVVYETVASVVGDHIEFTVDENIGAGKMRVELTVADGADVLQKYPAQGYIELNVTASLDDIGTGTIYTVTAAQMFARIEDSEAASASAVETAGEAVVIADAVRADFDLVVAEAGSSNPEVVLARGGEADLKTRLDKTSQQLAETGDKVNEASYGSKVLTGSTSLSQIKPLVTIIDDDGMLPTWDILKPIADEKNVKFCSAAIVKSIADENPLFMSFDQLRTLQNEGHEIMSHTMTHPQLGLIPLNQLDYELGMSRDTLRSEGLDAKNFVYPGGSYVKNNASPATDNSVLNAIRPYYDSAWVIENATNRGIFNNHRGLRQDFDTSTLAQAKAWVDDIFANGGWVVLMIHTFRDVWKTAEKKQDLRDFIDYVKSKNIDVVTVKEGLKLYGNIYEVGDTREDYLKIDRYGKITNKYNRYFTHNPNTISPTTPPSFFLENSVNLSYHDGATTITGFPESNIGTVITTKGIANLVVQEWHPYFTNNLKTHYFIRTNKYSNYNTEWNEWKKKSYVDTTVDLGTNVVTTTNRTAVIDKVVNKVKIDNGSTDLSNFPNGKAGTLTAGFYNENGFYTEEYEVYDSSKKFKRYKKADGSMASWSEYCYKKRKDISPVIPTIAAGAFAETNIDISDLGLTVADEVIINFAAAPPAGLMWSYYQNGTNIVLRLLNTSATSITGQTIYLRVMALINT